MAESELIEVVQLPSGEQIKKYEAPDGQLSYRRSNGTFVSPEVGKALEKNANRQVEERREDNQARFSVTPRSENDRQALVKERYPDWDETTGLSTDIVEPNAQERNSIRSWMENETIKQQIRNDPLLKSDKERQKAREARARQLWEDLSSVRNEKEAMQVLKSYNIY